jgi:hypothetical protein
LAEEGEVLVRPATEQYGGTVDHHCENRGPMEQHSTPQQKPSRLLTAKNGFVLHITPRVGPKKVTIAKTAGPHLVYGISYSDPEPMPVTLSN